MSLDLPVVFTAIMGAAVLLYVLFDGYDLGIAMLMPAATDEEQELMVASIGPFWDANETWLVLGVGVLLAAFPSAHGLVLTALYVPVAVMLLGLMLRGVAFEFRIKAIGVHRQLWNRVFSVSSFVAAFAQGWMLARYVTGFEKGTAYAVFAVVTGASLCGGYLLIGASWLILKTEGRLHEKARRWARIGLVAVAVGIALVSVATPLVSETVREKWFSFPRTAGLMLLPLATFVAGVWVWWLTAPNRGGAHWKPLAGTAAIFILAFAGLAYSLFPYVVIDRLTVWQAAAHPSSLRFVLVGVLVVLPFLLAYTAYAHRVFSGKVTEPLYE
jgi:cytochrome d ubiquinol oxidase subunit II